MLLAVTCFLNMCLFLLLILWKHENCISIKDHHTHIGNHVFVNDSMHYHYFFNFELWFSSTKKWKLSLGQWLMKKTYRLLHEQIKKHISIPFYSNVKSLPFKTCFNSPVRITRSCFVFLDMPRSLTLVSVKRIK